MSLRVIYEEKAIGQAAGFLADDPAGLGAALDAVDRLAGDPRPAGSFPYGSPDLRRRRAGRYRVMYEIKGDVVSIWHIARGKTSG
ncbi:MAG TPA: type II toxin-antitoxin system RelE/ParE family toxin [Streptosporangiaceae bacterium]|nr:type II toxin-antitoxin system RelE/ParE family toxin [Streptosporangiaceae bacterium]